MTGVGKRRTVSLNRSDVFWLTRLASLLLGGVFRPTSGGRSMPNHALSSIKLN